MPQVCILGQTLLLCYWLGSNLGLVRSAKVNLQDSVLRPDDPAAIEDRNVRHLASPPDASLSEEDEAERNELQDSTLESVSIGSIIEARRALSGMETVSNEVMRKPVYKMMLNPSFEPHDPDHKFWQGPTRRYQRGPFGAVAVPRNRWDHWGSDYGELQCDRREDVFCMVSGIVYGGVWDSIAQLGDKCRPHIRTIHLVNNHEDRSHVSVEGKTGTVRWVGGSSNHNWLSLSGMAFNCNHDIYWNPFYGTVNPLTETTQTGWTLVNEWCMLQGELSANEKIVVKLPRVCRPKVDRAVLVDVDNSIGLIWILTNGIIVRDDLVPGEGSSLSLTGVLFSVGDNQQSLTLGEHYWPVDGSLPQVEVGNGLCVCFGAVEGGSPWILDTLAILPPNCRPKKRLVFQSIEMYLQNLCRLDVTTDGNILLVYCSTWPLPNFMHKPAHGLTFYLGSITFAVDPDSKGGDMGSRGEEGKFGVRGAKGPKGGPGPSGPDGPVGDPGSAGAPGNPGDEGQRVLVRREV